MLPEQTHATFEILGIHSIKQFQYQSIHSSPEQLKKGNNLLKFYRKSNWSTKH